MNSLIGQELGHYRIIEQLGEGGMATVYKAFDTHLERDVAVKVIRTDQFGTAVLEKILKRFEREAKLLAKLSHPNIVGVIDYGEYENTPYLVMEYLPGGTLKERLGKVVPADEAARILLPIARALDFAHRQAMIHRDVKPSNILITSDNEPMLTDFGIAKLLDADENQTLTGTGVGIGTPEYMAPEQWLGKATAKSDQYSLGVIFYEMVTGRKPFIADTPAAILLKQTNDPLPSPGSMVPDLDQGVEKFIFKILSRDPDNRYPSMTEVIGELKKISSIGESNPLPSIVEPHENPPALSNETKVEVPPMPVFAYPPPVDLPERSNQGRRKIPWWIGIAGAVGLVLVILLIWGLAGGGPFNFYASSTLSVTLSNQSCATKNIYIDNKYYGTLSPYSERTLVLESGQHRYILCEKGRTKCESLVTDEEKIIIPYRSACK
jgi:serine/threonine protein kinase